MSFRKQQIESVLKRAISELLIRKISDPRIVGMVSITSVDVSPDMSQATVWISVIPQEHEKKTAAGLNHAAPYIHGLVRKLVTFRTVPHLDFRLDHDLKKQSTVLQAINKGVSREKTVDHDETDENQASKQDVNDRDSGQQQRRSSQERARREATRKDLPDRIKQRNPQGNPEGSTPRNPPTDTSNHADPNGQESSK